MAAAVFVSDERVLNVGIGVAELRLANLVEGDWLIAAAQAAYQGGADHLVRVGPFGDLPGTSRLVRVRAVDPVYRDDAMTLGVRWEAIGVTGGLLPVLDANIRLSGAGGQHTEVVLTASYRPPLGAAGAGLDRLLLHRVATATIKTFLAGVASVLEGTSEAAGESAASPWWAPGQNQPPGEARP